MAALNCRRRRSPGGQRGLGVAPALGTFLERLHAEVVRAKLREVVLDFRELNFLTSSCIKYLVVAINRLAETNVESQYELRLVSSPSMRWQMRSFEVLRQVAPDPRAHRPGIARTLGHGRFPGRWIPAMAT